MCVRRRTHPPAHGAGLQAAQRATQHARTHTRALAITPTCQCQWGHSHHHLTPTWNHDTGTLASTQHTRARARSSSVAAAERESDSESSLRPPAELEHEIEIKNRAQGTILPGEVASEMIAFVYVPALTSAVDDHCIRTVVWVTTSMAIHALHVVHIQASSSALPTSM